MSQYYIFTSATIVWTIGTITTLLVKNNQHVGGLGVNEEASHERERPSYLYNMVKQVKL